MTEFRIDKYFYSLGDRDVCSMFRQFLAFLFPGCLGGFEGLCILEFLAGGSFDGHKLEAGCARILSEINQLTDL